MGKLYGVSVGPGDPELLTRKAVRVLSDISVIAVPKTRTENAMALSIVRQVVNLSGKEIVTFDFPMSKDRKICEENYDRIAGELEKRMNAGKEIAFLTIGDVSVFSTFSYLAERCLRDGYEVEIIPGVPSFVAVADKLKIPLAQGKEGFLVLSGECGKLPEYASLDLCKVIMKSGCHLEKVKEAFAGQNVSAIRDCGLPTERLYHGLEEIEEGGYFTTLITRRETEQQEHNCVKGREAGAPEDRYICRGSQRLRCGYTTGSCAAGAARAAAEMLLSGETLKSVCLMTPKGWPLELTVTDVLWERTGEEASVRCGIVKDGGDDPDATNGITVYAKVSFLPEGIRIEGGPGVGVVTKKGLDQPVGATAINSTPRRMIEEGLQEMKEKYHYNGGFLVEIDIPGGEEIAKKTFNPKLGIEGGLSVIGTTGIVEPMSSRALIDTIRLEEKMCREAGKHYLLVTPGNYGKTFLKEYMPKVLENCVTCSNFIGEAIELALEYQFSGLLLVGHIGKLIKLGAGIMNTHSHQADGRMDVAIRCGVEAGMESSFLKSISGCVTVDDALSILQTHPLYESWKAVLMEHIHEHLEHKSEGRLAIGAIVFSNVYGVIGQTKEAALLRENILEEADKLEG